VIHKHFDNLVANLITEFKIIGITLAEFFEKIIGITLDLRTGMSVSDETKMRGDQFILHLMSIRLVKVCHLFSRAARSMPSVVSRLTVVS